MDKLTTLISKSNGRTTAVQYSASEMEEVFTADQRQSLAAGGIVEHRGIRYVDATALALKAGL